MRVPAASEGLITDLALATFNNVTPYSTRLLAEFSAPTLALAAEPLADFLPFTDLQAAPPAAWAVDATAVVQTAATAGGPLTLADPEKAGAQLLWRPKGVALNLPRFVASIDFASTSANGIGLVFHRLAPMTSTSFSPRRATATTSSAAAAGLPDGRPSPRPQRVSRSACRTAWFWCPTTVP